VLYIRPAARPAAGISADAATELGQGSYYPSCHPDSAEFGRPGRLRRRPVQDRKPWSSMRIPRPAARPPKPSARPHRGVRDHGRVNASPKTPRPAEPFHPPPSRADSTRSFWPFTTGRPIYLIQACRGPFKARCGNARHRRHGRQFRFCLSRKRLTTACPSYG
jgi:hypothetical protein